MIPRWRHPGRANAHGKISLVSPLLIFMLSLACALFIPVCAEACGPQPGVSSQAMSTQENKTQQPAAAKPIFMEPVGRVVRQGDHIFIDILPAYGDALDGLVGFSHIWVLFWFHGNDTPENRAILKVHPRKDPANPLTGVFATRAPVRPNLIGMTCCRLLKVEGTRLTVEGLDAWDGTPIVDLKPYLPQSDSHPEAVTPPWVKPSPKKSD
jgi:tRNA (adenine37-N6)-methyltransferase